VDGAIFLVCKAKETKALLEIFFVEEVARLCVVVTVGVT